MNRFIILGCGYLGTNISNYIAQNTEDEVFVVGIENEYVDYLDKRIVFVSKMIEQISEDDLELFNKAIVIDMVGNINATNDSKNSTTVFLNNCEGKVNLIQKLNKLKIKKYVFLSSGGTVYDDSNSLHREDEKLNPNTIYALEKVIIEEYLKIYGLENNSFSYLILRLSNPYGGIVSKSKKQGIIDVAVRKIKNQEIIHFYGEMGNIRDYIYIDNVAEYIYEIAICNRCNEIFNLGSGVGTSIKYIFEYIENALGVKALIEFETKSTVNIKSNVLNVDKINGVVQVPNMISINEGINRIIEQL